MANTLTNELKIINTLVSEFDKLQKNWIKLEPIFTQSADVKQNLMETARRFESMNENFKNMIKDMRLFATVKESSTVEGRVDNLKSQIKELDMCERELTAYLDQKKKKFPRFYFVSDKTLLTILSNSSKPLEVAKNLEDCFNGLKTIKFKFDEEGNPTKESLQMISLDGEIVDFHAPFNCVGEVEDWLRGLENHTRLTLKHLLNKYKDEITTGETDNPGTFKRQHWIDTKVAQLALLLDMISWTEEVNKAFEDRDEGNEDAMRTCSKLCKVKLEKMINKVIDGPQNGMNEKDWKALKTKTIAIITIQVHERDILDDLVKYDIKESSSFKWQSQLKFE